MRQHPDKGAVVVVQPQSSDPLTCSANATSATQCAAPCCRPAQGQDVSCFCANTARAEALLCFCLQGCTVEKTTLKKRFFKRSLWAEAVLHYHMTATSLSDISRDNQVHEPVPSGMCFST